MTILYKPVTIETEYQAGEFPEGTIAQHPEHRTAAVKTDVWEDDYLLWYDTDDGSQSPASLIGWTALVPIEAEEETTGALVNRAGEITWQPQTRYVTPWETA